MRRNDPSTLASLLVLLIAVRADALTATTAADVCAPDADPCSVTEEIDVSPGATLDFGLRTLAISGDGRLDFGSGSATVLSGPFRATTDGDAIVVSGPLTGGGTAGGSVAIQAQSLCSAGTPERTCLNDFHCQLGQCNTRRCSAKASRHCTADTDCVGTCTTSLRCSNVPQYTACATNADCNFGSCAPGLTCSGDSAPSVGCSVNADCDLGACSVGPASIDIQGGINGLSGAPGSLALRASDSVTIVGNVNLSATRAENSGGELSIRTGSGDAAIGGRLRARGGGFASGGTVTIDSGQDAVLTAPMDLSGGSGDGGFVDVLAERDIALSGDLNLTATAGAGYGGSLSLTADRDVVLGNGAARCRISANGHSDSMDAGDGGYVELSSGRDTFVAEGVDIRVRGGRSGFGGTFDARPDGDFDFGGRFDGRVRGAEGVAGYFEVIGYGDIAIGPTARIDMRGAYAGYIDLMAEEGNAVFDGSLRMAGSGDYEEGSFKLYACRISFAGKIENASTNGGYSQLVVRESMHLLPGSKLLTPSGDNFLTYRTADKPPVIEGTVTPAPILGIDYFDGCPVCGNSEIDDGETCDDGNIDDGDGCDSDCQVE